MARSRLAEAQWYIFIGQPVSHEHDTRECWSETGRQIKSCGVSTLCTDYRLETVRVVWWQVCVWWCDYGEYKRSRFSD